MLERIREEKYRTQKLNAKMQQMDNQQQILQTIIDKKKERLSDKKWHRDHFNADEQLLIQCQDIDKIKKESSKNEFSKANIGDHLHRGNIHDDKKQDYIKK